MGAGSGSQSWNIYFFELVFTCLCIKMGRIPTWRVPKPRTECDLSDTVDEESEEEEIVVKEADPGSIAFSFLKSGV